MTNDKPSVPIEVAPHITIEKQARGMADTSVPVTDTNVELSAKEPKKKYDCNDLLKEDICGISDSKKLRAYVMCSARKSGDMSSGIKDAWKRRKTCELISKK